jgi:hypothetical protein
VGNNNDFLETEATKGCLTHRLTDKNVLINIGLLSLRRMKGDGMDGACNGRGKEEKLVLVFGGKT